MEGGRGKGGVRYKKEGRNSLSVPNVIIPEDDEWSGRVREGSGAHVVEVVGGGEMGGREGKER